MAVKQEKMVVNKESKISVIKRDIDILGYKVPVWALILLLVIAVAVAWMEYNPNNVIKLNLPPVLIEKNNLSSATPTEIRELLANPTPASVKDTVQV
jgi:hypothetical protein